MPIEQAGSGIERIIALNQEVEWVEKGFGGFTDKSGGAYVFMADNFNEAKAIADTDPVFTSGSSTLTLREWNAKTN